jgi:hypothetical protein
MMATGGFYGMSLFEFSLLLANSPAQLPIRTTSLIYLLDSQVA